MFDHQTFDVQKVGGISRYFSGLLGHLKILEGASYILSIKKSNNIYLIASGQFDFKPISDSYKNFFFGLKFKGKYRLYNWYKKYFNKYTLTFQDENIQESKRLLELREFDVFHPTYYDAYFLDYIGEKPYVLTVHDLIEEKYPEFQLIYEETTGDQPYRDNKKRVLCGASRLIAISNVTKMDLVSYYGIDESKIDVVHLGTNLGQIKPRKPSVFSKDNNPYLLYVGDRRKYKNFYFALYAIKDLLLKRGLKLICVGGSLSYAENRFIQRIGLQDEVFSYQLEDDELVYMYKKAKALLFPSLAEGFGIPMIEAMACGCPVVASDTIINKEVLGDCGIFFEKKNPLSLRKKIEMLFDEPSHIDIIIKNGLNRVEQFSLSNMTNDTLEVYKKVLSGI